MKKLSLIALALPLLFACAGLQSGEDLPASALEVDGNGLADCVDLDHTLACAHHSSDPACARADVNTDGIVDEHDAHAVHSGLERLGHACPSPEGHLGGTGDHAASHHPDGGHDEGHHLTGTVTNDAQHADAGGQLAHDAGH